MIGGSHESWHTHVPLMSGQPSLTSHDARIGNGSMTDLEKAVGEFAVDEYYGKAYDPR